MNCELYKSEMYLWRPGSDAASFQPLFDHLRECPGCKRLFEQLTAADHTVQRTFQKLPADRSLESRILAGLAHQRAHAARSRIAWRPWLVLPVAASLVFGIIVAIRPQSPDVRLQQQMAKLLSKPPEAQINSDDRQQLLQWAANVVTGLSSLPPQLDRVEFRGAAALHVSQHRAVLLRMKNEPRASLLIVDARLTRAPGFHLLREASGSASLWSDGQRTYVLLYRGSVEEMHAYMAQMGIEG